jgi:hypothetical protein
VDNGGRGRRRRRRSETKGNIALHFFFFASNRAVSDEIRVDLRFFLFRKISCFFFQLIFFLWPGLLLSFFWKRKFFRQSAGVGGETPESFEAWKEAVVVVVAGAMATLDATRAELAFLVMYLNKAETRDKICRAIQYGSKFLSNGEPGVAAQVDKTTSLARKVFRLAKVSKKKSLLSISS